MLDPLDRAVLRCADLRTVCGLICFDSVGPNAAAYLSVAQRCSRESCSRLGSNRIESDRIDRCRWEQQKSAVVGKLAAAVGSTIPFPQACVHEPQARIVQL